MVMLNINEFKFSRDPWIPSASKGGEILSPLTRFVLDMKPGDYVVCRRPKYSRLKSAAYRRSIPWKGEKLGRGNYRFTRL